MTPAKDRVRPWERGVRRLGHGAFGLKPPEVADLPGVGEFTDPGVSRVELPLLSTPDASNNLTLIVPNLIRLDVREAPPKTQDLTQEFLSELAVGWEVLSLFKPLRFPAATGKSYEDRADQDMFGVPGHESFMPSERDLTEECIHGLIRSSCEYCSRKAARPKPRSQITLTAPVVNPLDLILPLLQPPLGYDFDNVVAFPVGKSLYPFQCEGVRFLVDHESALLGDEMGLGKSIQAIIALRLLFRSQKIRRVLLLSPKSVLFDWYHKLREWAPELSVLRVRASPQERAILWEMPAHIYLTTYSTLRNDIEMINPRRFDLCLLDEIQYIKNPGAGVTRATRDIDARMRWGLTGTPLENKIEDVISLFAYLKPGLLQYTDAERPGRVKDHIRPYFLRRRAADVLDDLPDKVSHEVWLELGPAQRAAYEQAFDQGRSAIARERTVTHVLAQISKLKQLCNLDPSSGESTKLEYLYEQLTELRESDEKGLVFSQYPMKTLEAIEPHLSEFHPKLFHGQLSDRERDRIVREFQEQDELGVLLMSVRAGGVGLTLTRANHVFHFDLWWNPAVAWQAEGRAHRIGQQKTVFVKTLYTVDTIEQRIHEILAEKQAMFDFVIDDLSDQSLGKLLTEDELFSLFDLEPGRAPSGSEASSKPSQRLQYLNPIEFEALVARLYKRMGFNVELTKTSRDEGVDIYAQRPSDAGVERLLIQCKHYFGGTVSVSDVRELYGALRARQNVGRAVLVTSGRFSQPCHQFAGGKSIDLIPLDQLTGLLAKYDLLDDLGDS